MMGDLIEVCTEVFGIWCEVLSLYSNWNYTDVKLICLLTSLQTFESTFRAEWKNSFLAFMFRFLNNTKLLKPVIEAFSTFSDSVLIKVINTRD